MRRAGEALAAMVAGIRALLIARADVKREFRIEQTMLRRSNNDPLKFAATDEAALAALIGPDAGRRAVAATIDDLVAHQAASLAATQAAARAMLARLDPAAIEGEEQGGRIFGTREKRCWEAYKKLHADMMARFDDDFDGVFGKEFARAYEAASKR
jgi:type VI secretion system protein ImpI/type VI secretion system protein